MTPKRLEAASVIIKGVLFDLDNTLFDRDMAFSKWAEEFARDQFADRSEDYRTQVLKQIVAIDAHGYTTKKALFTQMRERYPTITDEVEALCERFYRDWLIHMTLARETECLLDELDCSGIPFGIITNGPAQQHDKIRQLGLHHRTQCLFVSEEFGCNKPDPSIFRAAASDLEVPCEHILFVGDNPAADICGAHAVGMTTAWLPCGASWPAELAHIEPDYVIDSLGDLSILFAANSRE